jgi:outer membrane protein
MKRVALFLLAGLPALVTFGQTGVLSFEEAVKIGLENSVSLNQEKQRLALAQVQKNSGWAQLAPSIGLNGNAFRVDGNSFNQQQGTIVKGKRDAVTGSIGADVTLFNGFNRINNAKMASSALDAQTYHVHRTTQDVINAIAGQYLQVLLDKELLRIAQENLETQQRQFELISEQVKLGVRSPVDEYNQDAQVKRQELLMLQAEITLNNDKAALSQTLLLDPSADFDVQKPVWDINQIGGATYVLDSMYSTALRSRSDYLRAVSNEASLRFSAKSAFGTLTPNLTAFGNYGSAYNFIYGLPDSVSNLVNRDFSEQFRSDNVYKNYGLTLQIPLFNGLQRKAFYYQERTNYLNSRWVTRNLEILVKNDVRRAYLNFESAKKGFMAGVSQLEAATMAYSLETERFNLGITNFADYVQSNRSYVEAQTAKAQAEYRLVFQRILLEYAMGTLRPEDLQ